jgi:hypothetical protein
MKDQYYSRRRFMNRLLSTGSLLIGGAFLLNSCDSSQPGEAPSGDIKKSRSEDPCNDLSGISDGERMKRESLGYVKKTTNPENYCGNCSLYIPPKEGEECGGCILFKGPVDSNGHCVQWAAITG